MWVYKGKEYNVPPKAMIVDVILREVYGNTEKKSDNEANKKSYQLPKNLRRFFESI